MIRKWLMAALVSLLLGTGAVAVSQTPAQAGFVPIGVTQVHSQMMAPGCSVDYICFHDTKTEYPWLSMHSSTPRNTCYQIAAYTSFITNNTSVQWYVFRTGDCSGSHQTAFPYLGKDMTLITGWDNAIRSFYRTSSTGGTAPALADVKLTSYRQSDYGLVG